MSGAVLHWLSYWGVSHFVAQIEPCFLRIFSHFSGTGELNFLMKKSYEGAHYYYYYYYYYYYIHIYIYTLL